MKEVTYEDWQKNPTPRMMWVWDSYGDAKVQEKVVFIKSGGTEPVIAITYNDLYIILFKHCAEIEKPRRMTNKEIAELKKDLINSNERLIKAKNLLTRFVMGSVYFNGKETNLVEEAEQFISEIEK